MAVKTRPSHDSSNPEMVLNIPRFQACPEAMAEARAQGAQGPRAEEQWDVGQQGEWPGHQRNLMYCCQAASEGLVLLGSAVTVKPPKALFFCPLLVLNCLQPMLSRAFISAAFSASSRADNPQMISKATQAADRNGMAMCKAFYRQFEWDLSDEQLARVSCPVCIIHGEADSVLPLEGAVALHARLKQARLHIVANCSHQLHQEQPGEVMQIVSAFFSSAFAGQLGPGS